MLDKLRRRHEIVATNVDSKPLWLDGEWVGCGEQVVVDEADNALDAWDLGYRWQEMVPLGFRVSVI